MTRERAQFLSNLMVTAIEHRGYGFPGVVEWVPEPGGDPAGSYAVIYDRYEEPGGVDPQRTWRIDVDTMERGLVIVRGMDRQCASWITNLQLSDRTNGADGGYDVVGALLVLECAVFGEPVYA